MIVGKSVIRLCREESPQVPYFSSNPTGRTPAAPTAAGPTAAFLMFVAAALAAGPAGARPAPDGFADLAARLLPSVVNISTAQTLKSDHGREHPGPEIPQFPPGSPFEEFFS